LNPAFNEAMTSDGVGNRRNSQIHYMSVGTGQHAGDQSLSDKGQTPFPAGYGVYDDPAVAYVATDAAESDVALETEVDRVELGVAGAMTADINYGGEVLGNKVRFVAEFHPDTRFGTMLEMQEGQFQPLNEAGLHNSGLDIFADSSDYENGRGGAGNANFSQIADDRMAARVTFPTISKGPLDLIRITWTITVGG
jgi:hypothetical protein